jgi:hypothetical protein
VGGSVSSFSETRRLNSRVGTMATVVEIMPFDRNGGGYARPPNGKGPAAGSPGE